MEPLRGPPTPAPKRGASTPEPAARAGRAGSEVAPPRERARDVVARGAPELLGCLAIRTLPRRWRVPDERWAVKRHWRPEGRSRASTKDYRRGYPGVWALEERMRRVAPPYLLRTRLARIGAEITRPEPAERRR